MSINLEQALRQKMAEALKQGDSQSKAVYSAMVSALYNRKKSSPAGEELTPDKETEVILKLLKQNQESIDTCPKDRTDILKKLSFERNILLQYAPKQLSDKEIRQIIERVLSELKISVPTAKEAGKIKKILMPQIKGKADGRRVNELLNEYFV